jgi:hypothetical protein
MRLSLTIAQEAIERSLPGFERALRKAKETCPHAAVELSGSRLSAALTRAAE